MFSPEFFPFRLRIRFRRRFVSSRLVPSGVLSPFTLGFGCDPFSVPDVPDTRANIKLYIRLDPVTHNTCPLPWYVLWCLVFICVFLTPARYFHPSVDIQGNQVSVPILRTWNIDVMWPQNNATEILQQYIVTGMQ